MVLIKRFTLVAWLNLLAIVSIVSLLALQSLWLYNAYRLTYNQLIIDVDNAFDQAYHNEQVYRMPLGTLVNHGKLTIQGSGQEKIVIIRNCPSCDTLVYDNTYGQSMETFINKALYELRERTLPMNIHCLADLFAGALHDKDIQLSFVIERFNPVTQEVLETTTPNNGFSGTLSTHVIMTNVSETEGLRAKLQFSPQVVFQRMTGILTGSLLILCLILLSIILRQILVSRRKSKSEGQPLQLELVPEEVPQHSYILGQYRFDADKNELQGFGQCVNLNKKEHAILTALCVAHGNVVERGKLLEDNWGSTGFIYSRSLDTYVTKLRKYLKDDPTVQIVTIKSVGYKLTIA